MSSRRQRFRTFIAAFNGAGAPADALAADWYVEPMDPVAERVARRLELQPASAHLITGHVGTGKSTQLLVIGHDKLARTPDVKSLLIDLSKYQDLNHLKPGSLMALTGLLIGEQCEEDRCNPEDSARARELIASFRSWADGYIDPYQDLGHQYDDPPEDWVPGVVRPPPRDLDEDMRLYRDQLSHLRELVYGPDTSLVLLVDSLDRISASDGFKILLTHDVKALLSAGLGVVLIGPLRATYGLERTISDQLELYRQPAIDLNEERGRQFLREIIQRRDEPTGLLGSEAIERIIDYSGGVLRDLLKLAQKAGEEAYVSGFAQIGAEHVAVAADGFGRTLMIGLDAGSLAKLRDVAAGQRFVVNEWSSDLELLLTRRIVEYQDQVGLPHHAVHPTLQRLLSPSESSDETSDA